MSVSASDLPVATKPPEPSTEFATDIADVYPGKEVTLVHSRDQLLPRFDKWMHDSGTVSLAPLLFSHSRPVYTSYGPAPRDESPDSTQYQNRPELP